MRVIHKKQAWRKSYLLKVTNNGNLVVTTNKLCTSDQVKEILRRHRLWISRRLKEFEKISKRLYKTGYNHVNNGRKLRHGHILHILGNKHVLVLNENVDVPRHKVHIKEKKIILESPNRLTNTRVKEILVKHLREVARKVCEEKVEYYTQLYGVKHKKIFIKAQRSKWGSCSSERILNFNWKLLLCPEDVLEYVVIHEVCHLKELNHSDKFWNLVEKHCPDYNAKREWLREEGYSILNQFA